MKRIGNLYNKIISIENLQLADKKLEKENYEAMVFNVMTEIENRIY